MPQMHVRQLHGWQTHTHHEVTHNQTDARCKVTSPYHSHARDTDVMQQELGAAPGAMLMPQRHAIRSSAETRTTGVYRKGMRRALPQSTTHKTQMMLTGRTPHEQRSVWTARVGVLLRASTCARMKALVRENARTSKRSKQGMPAPSRPACTSNASLRFPRFVGNHSSGYRQWSTRPVGIHRRNSVHTSPHGTHTKAP